MSPGRPCHFTKPNKAKQAGSQKNSTRTDYTFLQQANPFNDPNSAGGTFSSWPISIEQPQKRIHRPKISPKKTRGAQRAQHNREINQNSAEIQTHQLATATPLAANPGSHHLISCPAPNLRKQALWGHDRVVANLTKESRVSGNFLAQGTSLSQRRTVTRRVPGSLELEHRSNPLPCLRSTSRLHATPKPTPRAPHPLQRQRDCGEEIWTCWGDDHHHRAACLLPTSLG